MGNIPRLLVIRLRSLGDSILALPLLEALHDWRPDLQIDVLAESPYAAVFARHPALHETLRLRPRTGPGQEGWRRARACLEIRRRRYGAVLNLHGGTTSALLTLASGARLRIGQQKYRHAWIYHHLIPPPPMVWQRTALHTVEDQMTFMRWLQLPVPARPRARLHLDPGARARIGERLAAAAMQPARFLLIHPTATLDTKRWQERKFAELADRLHERHHLPVVFSSAPFEAPILQEIGRHARHAHRYWSDLGLDELFALIEQCRMFVGNDSGPTHAAAALGKSLVVIWGSSDFRVWHPWETEYAPVRLELSCMPCPGYSCSAFDTPKCIRDIGVERVMAACESVMSDE
jgi:ADP-heptose:LPS heptosyltransferase